jgi:hypothetical protein
MTFGIGNHSRSPSCFNLNAGMGTFRLSVRRPGDRLTARWISDRSRGRGSDMNRSVLGAPGSIPTRKVFVIPRGSAVNLGVGCDMARGDYLIVWSAASRMDRLDDRGSVYSYRPPSGEFYKPGFQMPARPNKKRVGIFSWTALTNNGRGTESRHNLEKSARNSHNVRGFHCADTSWGVTAVTELRARLNA